MEKRVLGLDISRNFAVGFLLFECPQSPFDWFNSFPSVTHKRKKQQYSYNSQSVFLTNDSKGLKRFQELKPDIIILEPTGYWYSQYWVLQAEKLGCEILWMSHQSLCRHRAHYGFKNKNDDIDAFVLALTYFDEMLPKKRFMTHYNYPLIHQLRLAFYERKRLLKAINQNTSQIGQYLEVEFPEIATRSLVRLGVNGVNPTLGHLTGVAKNRKWPAQNTGLGVSRRTITLAVETMTKQSQVDEQETIIKELLNYREFIPYLQVFKDYGFGLATSADLLLKIYPIERFLDNGKVSKDKKGRDLSLRQFQAYLGYSYTYSKSGDSSHAQNKVKKSWQGSTLTRSDLYAWILSNPCKVNIFKPKTVKQHKLKELWVNDRKRAITKKGLTTEVTLPSFESLGKDGICRMAFVISRWLWNDLLKAINALDF